MATLSADVLNAFVGTPTEVTVRGPKSFLRAAGADNNPFGRWWFAAEIPSALMNPSNGFRCRPASIVREL